MVIVGVVGSPRKNGRTNSLIDAVLEGAKSRGAEVKKVYLVDYELRQYKGLDGSAEAFTYCPEELSKLCDGAEAFAIGAPIYWGDINGMTKDFMDTVKIPITNGKPALGVTIAGGSGRGQVSGVQSLYTFFFHKQMRAIDPTPVSRFNMQDALDELKISGGRLVDLSKKKETFPGNTVNERLPVVQAYYTSLKYLNYDPLDECIMLDQQLIKVSEGKKEEEAKVELDKALELISKGNRSAAAEYAVKVYLMLYFTS
ncbi:MAG: hypothetical protein QG670_907 [Thermoproteota archaeon]|nr:hypothetical protein [Thermoproteota archaeon]